MERNLDPPLVWAPAFSARENAVPLHADPHDPVDIPAWHRLAPGLTTSGQPAEAHLERLAALGIGHVINLALHSHEQALADEGASLSRLDIGYTYIPVDFSAPTEADFAAFCAAMAANVGAALHVHCILNLRVSAFLYRYRREVVGLSETAAAPDLDRLWRPGGAWAKFIGRPADAVLPHRYPGQDYDLPV